MEEQEKKPMAVPQYPPVYYYPEDEITLKELILKFLEYLQEFRRNLALIVLITAATVAIAVGYQQYKGYEYQTSLTYKLDQVTYIRGFNQLVPSFLNLDISTAQLTALTYENEFLSLLMQHYIFQEILQKKKAATTYLTEQQSFVQEALQEQQELKRSMGTFAREEADKIILNYINQKNDLENKLNQLNLLNILEAPSVKVTQRTVTPEVIGTSISKIIVVSSILGLFLALGWVMVRKMVKDALS